MYNLYACQLQPWLCYGRNIYIMILYIISYIYIYIIESLNSIAKAAVDSFEDVSEHSEGTYFNDCLA